MSIRHLDELIFSPPEISNSIYQGIAKHQFPVSLKWDGSPSFVTGVDSNGFFLAFKNGYYRKEKLLYRTEKDLNDISEQSLRQKMVVLMISFSKFYKDTSSMDILGGDYMCDTFHETQGTTQPNTIEYWVNWPHDYLVGVAIHTVNGIPSSFKPKYYEYSNILWVDTEPKIEFDTEKLTVFEDYSDIKKTVQTKFFRWVNQNLREYQCIKDYDDLCAFDHVFFSDARFQNIIAVLKYVWLWKRKIIQIMRIDYNVLVPKNMDHEGLVFDTPQGLFKLVDRETFSAVNFKNHQEKLKENICNSHKMKLMQTAKRWLNI